MVWASSHCVAKKVSKPDCQEFQSDAKFSILGAKSVPETKSGSKSLMKSPLQGSHIIRLNLPSPPSLLWGEQRERGCSHHSTCQEMMENYLQTNHDWGSHWETAKDEPCQASGERTVISAEHNVSVLKEVEPERLPRRLRQGASAELHAPPPITVQLARELGERGRGWQQLCFTVALNKALAKGDQGPSRAGRTTKGGTGTS